MNTVTLSSVDGTPLAYIDRVIGSGTMKDVYRSSDGTYVIGFYRQRPDTAGMERLKKIVGSYRTAIFTQEGGDYWQDKFCWPTHLIDHGGRVGLAIPIYDQRYFFAHGSLHNDSLNIRGKEKNGKWLTDASLRQRFLDPREKGEWISYFRLCLNLARIVRRLHAAGLAHSDLSLNNVLVDPLSGSATLIDIDGLVVPGLFPPDVLGTTDFIAPEVIASSHLPLGDPARIMPSRTTDQHALAVMLYMYLLYRHPLRGGIIHDPNDSQRDEQLSMGEKALFIEHPQDARNRPTHWKDSALPWADVAQTPYSLLGPYLKPLFDRALIDGLHQPALRPAAAEWETALVKTLDLMQPCTHAACPQKWYVFDNRARPVCPFCRMPYLGSLPILNLYADRGGGKFTPDQHRVMVYHEQYLYPWHVNSRVFPNEKLTADDKRPVGYCVLHNGQWLLVNQRLPELYDKSHDRPIPIGEGVVLREGLKLLFSRAPGGRLAVVQMAQGV
jgi:serine/threonine protein kinase